MQALVGSFLAEGEGFEPPVGFPTPVFKTGAIVHSAIPPGPGRGHYIITLRELTNSFQNWSIREKIRQDPARGGFKGFGVGAFVIV